jgi:predicted acylesterase/phospholipase RssA
MAHLGLLRVLEEEGIPVDMIVGTSVGAFVGGLYAKHASYLEILPYASRFAQNMSNTWLFLKDFTMFPFTSYFNGYSFGRELEKARALRSAIRHARFDRQMAAGQVKQTLSSVTHPTNRPHPITHLQAFGDTKIEDCWLSFGCVTVDLSVSQVNKHQPTNQPTNRETPHGRNATTTNQPTDAPFPTHPPLFVSRSGCTRTEPSGATCGPP